jgi:hypothetical protein
MSRVSGRQKVNPAGEQGFGFVQSFKSGLVR